MSVPGGGPKACSFGCTGFGSCVKVCDFDAIHVINGVAVVDKENVLPAVNVWQLVRNL